MCGVQKLIPPKCKKLNDVIWYNKLILKPIPPGGNRYPIQLTPIPIGIKQIEKAISIEVRESLHFADKNNVKLTIASIEIRPPIAIRICACSKFIFTRLMTENNIWNKVFKHSVPKAKSEIAKWIEIHITNIIINIENRANILVNARRICPCFVQRRMLSDCVWYSPEKVGAAIATHIINNIKI